MVYKITLDMQEIDKGKLIDYLIKQDENIEICLGEDCFYIWCNQQRDVAISMRNNKITKNYFIQTITKHPDGNPNGAAQAWVIEHLNRDEKMTQEEKLQKDYQEMLNRIENAKKCFLSIKEGMIKKIKEDQKEGGAENERRK